MVLRLIPGDSRSQTFVLFNDLFQLPLWRINSLPCFHCVHSDMADGTVPTHIHAHALTQTRGPHVIHHPPQTHRAPCPCGRQKTHLILSPRLLFHVALSNRRYLSIKQSQPAKTPLPLEYRVSGERKERGMEGKIARVSERWNPGNTELACSYLRHC